jgi:signal transduction histidine kinase
MAQRPLSDGNRFQRWYARWAEPYYGRMPEAQREEARRLDRWLYSRRGAWFWLGLLGAIAGSTGGLHAAGMPWWLAAVLSLAVWPGLMIGALGAWMAPEKFTTARLLRVGLFTLAGALAGLLIGFVTGRVVRHGGLKVETLGDAVVELVVRTMPGLLVLSAAMAALLWLVASSRRWQVQRELHDLQLVSERDAAARQAAEARLRLLQGQIQPHFIFNTLSAVQHWVDTGDPRAAALLRELTAFLRGSTEALGRDVVTLAEESAMVGHYLAIMQARMGERLRSEVEIEPGLEAQRLPPGLLLTLVENAVEHGVAPALRGGTVTLRAARDLAGACTIAVRDDGVGLAAGWREGVGLANCRERLATRYGHAASLMLREAAPGCEARVVLPGAAEEGAAR